MSRRNVVRACVVIGVAALPQVALAVAPAHTATALAPPAAGTWKMVPSAARGFVSGSFTVKGQTVTGLRAKIKKGIDCPGGILKVTAPVPIIEANLGHGHIQWEVASGGSAVDPGELQPTAVTLTIRGQREVNATMSIGFPAKGAKDSGQIGWGDDGTGFQDCGVSFKVKQG